MPTWQPDSRIIRSARSMILTGTPISSMKISPPLDRTEACKHQLDGLLDAHEEAGHPWVGDGDRTALGDLAGEGGDDAAPAAEHVAESHRAVGGALGCMGQDGLLGHPLGGPHHTGGVDGLVGRDLHEPAGAHHRLPASTTLSVPNTFVLAASRGCCSSTGTCLWAAAWNTISGRKCSKVSKTASRSKMSTSACSDGPGDGGGRVVQVGLVVVEENQLRRPEAGHLPADFRADGAACTGDEHPLTLDEAADGLEVRGHRGPSEEVLDLGLTGLAQGGHVVGLVRACP